MSSFYGTGQPQLPKFRLDYSLLSEATTLPPAGLVLPEDKTEPTEEAELTPDAAPYIFTRGTCDIGEVRAKLQEDPAVWSVEFARLKNVVVQRPSHDAWGIRKLVFKFSDDFLKRCYELPLWDEWQSVLRPVFECCGVDPATVVRCLLASMPPKTVIPVHHDSGYWVKRTHRMHCAVVTDVENVVFRVGRTADEMHRFALHPGHVVELNNQAKHYVAHLGSDQYRTHLIFDYVDPSVVEMPPVIRLRVGDELVQTRRSIDLKSERGSAEPAPHFLIIGAQKAGTTSMYEYLAAHPLVIRGKRRETHFLDWRWPTGPRTSQLSPKDLRRCWHETFFDVDQHYEHPSLIAGDSTPSYLLASHLAIPRLQRMGITKIPLVVMLRDPVDRALSHYAMIVDPNATPAQRRTRGTAWLQASFQQVATQELHDLVSSGLLVPQDTTTVSFSTNFHVDPTKLTTVLSRLPNNHGSHSLLLRGLYAVQLEPWLAAFDPSTFVFVRCEDLADPVSAANELLKVQRHVGLREHPLPVDDRHNVRQEKPFVDPAFLDDLRRFYKPFNYALYDLLRWHDSSRRWDV